MEHTNELRVNTLGEKFLNWAQSEESIRTVTQIGSRVREVGAPGQADNGSDWDFQIIAANHAMLDEKDFFARAGLGNPIVAVSRGGRFGTVKKLTAVFADGELDVVVIPLDQFKAVRDTVRAQKHMENPMVLKALTDMALVLAGGFRILKDIEGARDMYDFVAKMVPLPRITDSEVRSLADGFACDYVSLKAKLARGELIAAQRWLHHNLAETNLRLLHELKLRKGLPSFPDGRRIETTTDNEWVGRVGVSSLLEGPSLAAAADRAALTCLDLVHALIGDNWQWPDV